MKEPVRLVNRGGFGSTLLRAGSEERPSGALVRRAVSTIGVAAAASALTGEAAGGAIMSGAVGALAKGGAGTVSFILAAKWLGIGALGGLVTVGAAEIGSRARAPEKGRVANIAAPHAADGIPPAPGTPERAVAASNSPSTAHTAELAAGSVARNAASTLASSGAQPEPASPRPRAGAEDRGPSSSTSEVLSPHAPATQVLRSAKSTAREALPTAPPAVQTASAPPRDTRLPEAASSQGREEPPSAPNTSPSTRALRLAKEVSLVDGAWGAMKRNDAAGALAALATTSSNFPSAAFTPKFSSCEWRPKYGWGMLLPRSSRRHASCPGIRTVASCASPHAFASAVTSDVAHRVRQKTKG